MSAQIKNLEHVEILAGGDRQIAFPFLAQLEGGEVALLFRDAPFTKGSGQTHIHSESRVSMLVSHGPASWGKAARVEIPSTGGAGNAPALHPLGGGKYMLIDYRWSFFADGSKPKESFKDAFLGLWVGYEGAYTREAAFAGGEWSFGPERKISAGDFPAILTSTSALRMGPAEYLAPCFCYEANWYFDNRVFLIRTVDGGATWQPAGDIERRTAQYAALHETAIAETGEPGGLVALMRTTNKFDYMMISRSEDGGAKWSALERTEIQGHPPNLLSLGGGLLVCTYAYSIKDRAIRLCISRDYGKTWDTENAMDLRAGLPEGDFGRPFTLSLGGNTLLTAYYFQDENQEYHIHAARYELEV